MNKKITVLLFSLTMLCGSIANAQLNIEIKWNDPNGNEVGPEKITIDGENPKLSANHIELKKFTLKCDNLESGHTLEITPGGQNTKIYSNTIDKVFTFSNNLIGKIITIVHKNGEEVINDGFDFKFVKEEVATGTERNETDNLTRINVGQSINNKIKIEKIKLDLKKTRYGYVEKTDKKDEGEIIHLFFDHFGNSLLGTIPQGIADAQYMVHIFYPINTAENKYVSYSVNKTGGEYSDGLVIYNSGLKDANGKVHGEFESNFNDIEHRTFELATSTSDLTFEIVRSSEGENGEIIKKVLGTYILKMSKVYHVSMDIGLLKSNLSNPTYSLVNLPNTNYMVVKETNNSPKGVVTIMASFYVSPWILAKRYLFGGSVPKYKLWGRSFLNDHEWWERMYPAVGVGLSEKSFENLFVGMNWEIARGLCVFYGWHWGKVNTFAMPNYVVGETPVTENQFDFYKNNAWKRSSAFGLKLDILVIRNLFGSSSGL